MIKCVVVVPVFNFHLVNQMINQNYVQIMAIVTDNRVIASERGLPKELTYAFWQFREVVQNLQPDYVLMLTVSDDPSFEMFKKEARKVDFPTEKIIQLSDFLYYSREFDLGKMLEKYEQNPNQYQILTTGLSYTLFGIEPNSFDLPLIKFAFASQDLYYDYQIARKILNEAVPPPIYT